MTLNEKVLAQYNLTKEEFLVLWALKINPYLDLEEVKNNLLAKKKIYNKRYKGVIISTEPGKIIKDMQVSSTKEVIKEEDRLIRLIPKLQELYPKGKKDGTSYYWRGSKPELYRKLKYLIKNGAEFTDEQALQATKDYISSFNGQYTYMHLLKYFLSKKERVDGVIEEKSEFLSYIENIGQNNVTSDDWTGNIV